MRRLFGGEIDRPLLPILGVTLSGSIAGSMLSTFVGVWAIKHLGARRTSNSRSPFSAAPSPRQSAASSEATGVSMTQSLPLSSCERCATVPNARQ